MRLGSRCDVDSRAGLKLDLSGEAKGVSADVVDLGAGMVVA